ncbi:hypothetical protein pb186bvf_007761 [Paramecium bursaria]
MNLRKYIPSITRKRFAISIILGSSYFLYAEGRNRYRAIHYTNMYDSIPPTDALTQAYFGQNDKGNQNIIRRLWEFLRRQFRLAHLILKFTPLALTFPIAYIFKKQLFDYWIDFLLYTIQDAGPLWIKLGQWASHRGDIFGKQVTLALEKLRDQAPPHSVKDTYKEFKLAFGQEINEIFTDFQEQPLASGSIAQVHQAQLNGQSVVIKVRHPHIMRSLELDIKILYQLAKFFGQTLGIKQLGMPVSFNEFEKTLIDQTDLRLEGRNLKVFNEKFENNPQVIFPKPIEPYIAANVLTETYEQGIPLTGFINQKRTMEHYTLANLGLKAFYKMLIIDNFIHADCHAGNILIRIEKKDNQNKTFSERLQFKLWNLQDTVFEIVENYKEQFITSIAEWDLDGEVEKKKQVQTLTALNQEKKDDEVLYMKFVKSFEKDQKNEVKIIFLDPGMVTILNDSDRVSFIKLIMFVTLRKPIECGKLMLELANYNQTVISEATQIKYMDEMKNLFVEVCKVPLAQMNIGEVLRSMLDILKQNGLSIEGHFAALLTNMIVLEGLAKQLDPELNIVAKAASFLIHKAAIDRNFDEIIRSAL